MIRAVRPRGHDLAKVGLCVGDCDLRTSDYRLGAIPDNSGDRPGNVGEHGGGQYEQSDNAENRDDELVTCITQRPGKAIS